MPRITEQLVLLMHDEHGVLLPINTDIMNSAVTGAALMDLAFECRIDTDLEALIVQDASPTGMPPLDALLAKIAAHTGLRDTKTWLGVISAEDGAGILEHTLNELARRGLVRPRGARTNWKSEAVDELRRDVAEVLSTELIPDPREVALVSLLDACEVLPEVYAHETLVDWRPRIAQLARMDLIGREVAGAIAHIERIIIESVRARAAKFRKAMLQVSVVAGIGGLATFALPSVPIPDRFGSLLERLWFDGDWQLWSGYALLAILVAAFLAGPLRRVRTFSRKGGIHWWRLAHVLFGLLCVIALFVHTGLRLGHALNAALTISFVGALVFGALAGISTSGASLLRQMGVSVRWRQLSLRLHLLMLVSLPALLSIHLLIVYMY